MNISQEEVMLNYHVTIIIMNISQEKVMLNYHVTIITINDD